MYPHHSGNHISYSHCFHSTHIDRIYYNRLDLRRSPLNKERITIFRNLIIYHENRVPVLPCVHLPEDDDDDDEDDDDDAVVVGAAVVDEVVCAGGGGGGGCC